MSSASSNQLRVLFHLFCCPPFSSITLPFSYLSPISSAFLRFILIYPLFFFLFYSYLYAVNFLLLLFPLLSHLFWVLFCFLLRLLRYIVLYLHFLFIFHCFSYHSSFFFSSPSFALSSLFDQFCVLLMQVVMFSTNHVLVSLCLIWLNFSLEMNNYLSRNNCLLITSLQLLMVTEIKWPRYIHFPGLVLGI